MQSTLLGLSKMCLLHYCGITGVSFFPFQFILKTNGCHVDYHFNIENQGNLCQTLRTLTNVIHFVYFFFFCLLIKMIITKSYFAAVACFAWPNLSQPYAEICQNCLYPWIIPHGQLTLPLGTPSTLSVNVKKNIHFFLVMMNSELIPNNSIVDVWVAMLFPFGKCLTVSPI